MYKNIYLINIFYFFSFLYTNIIYINVKLLNIIDKLYINHLKTIGNSFAAFLDFLGNVPMINLENVFAFESIKKNINKNIKIPVVILTSVQYYESLFQISFLTKIVLLKHSSYGFNFSRFRLSL